MFHMSHVTCHMSCVIYHMSHVTIFFLLPYKVVKLIAGGSVICYLSKNKTWCSVNLLLILYKKDRVGPIDNRPSTNYLKKNHFRCDTWRATCGMWGGGLNILWKCLLPSSFGLGLKASWRFGGKAYITSGLLNDLDGVARFVTDPPLASFTTL